MRGSRSSERSGWYTIVSSTTGSEWALTEMRDRLPILRKQPCGGVRGNRIHDAQH